MQKGGKAPQQQAQQPQQQVQQPQASMQMYYDAGGGCFAAGCLVKLRDGSSKAIETLRAGDVLDNGARVRALIRIANSGDKMALCAFPGGLKITPKHPIFVEGRWAKPSQVVQPQLFDCAEVYNLILDQQHQACINGVTCVTLGHNLKGQNVEHPYFGSNKIVSDLLRKPSSSENGVISIQNSDFLRNPLYNDQIYGIN